MSTPSREATPADYGRKEYIENIANGFFVQMNGSIFSLVDLLASLDQEAADNDEDVDTELVSKILALQVGESIGEGMNMETITRVSPAMLYKADGTVEEFALPIGGETLEVLQKAVGGSIQLVSTTDGRDMWVNEDGKGLGLLLNVKASMLWEGYDFGDPIVGDVVVTIAGLVE